MRQNLQKVLKNLEVFRVSPPSGIKPAILLQIGLETNKQIQKKLMLSCAGLLSSVAAIVYMGINFGDALLRSEFWRVASLAFSDFAVVAKHWNSFLPSLVETLPGSSVVLILIPIFILLISLNYFLELYKKFDYWQRPNIFMV